MKIISFHLALLIIRLGFSIGLITHGYVKFLKVIQGDFKFSEPLGIGSAPSLILTSFGEFIAPIFIIIGYKTRFFSFFPTITMSVAFLIAHAGDPFSRKEKSFVYLIAFLALCFSGPGKYSLDKE